MKRITFFTLAAAAFFALFPTAFFTSCSEDALDEQEQQLTKADILRAKAKELAKKYNVDMTLNEEDIDSLAEVLTVEQMERGFQEFARHIENFKPVVVEERHTVKPKRLSIRRTIGLTEYINKRLTGTLSGSDVYLNNTRYPTGSSSIMYECGGQGKDMITVETNVNGYKVEDSRLPASITVCGEEIEYLYAAGTVTASSAKYRYSANITVDYSKNSGLHVHLCV